MTNLIKRHGRTVVEHYQKGNLSWSRFKKGCKSVEITLEADGSLYIVATETPLESNRGAKAAYVCLSSEKTLEFARAIIAQHESQ